MFVERRTELALGVDLARNEMRVEKRLFQGADHDLPPPVQALDPHDSRRVSESGDALESWKRGINYRRSNLFGDAGHAHFRQTLAIFDCDFAIEPQSWRSFHDLPINHDLARVFRSGPATLAQRQ